MRSLCLLVLLALMPAVGSAGAFRADLDPRAGRGGTIDTDAAEFGRSGLPAGPYQRGWEGGWVAHAAGRSGSVRERAPETRQVYAGDRASLVPGSVVAIGLGMLGFVVIARRGQRRLWQLDSTRGEAHWI